jgi:hypothetical protein
MKPFQVAWTVAASNAVLSRHNSKQLAIAAIERRVRRKSKETEAGRAPQCFCYTVQRNDGKPAGYERGGWA